MLIWNPNLARIAGDYLAILSWVCVPSVEMRCKSSIFSPLSLISGCHEVMRTASLARHSYHDELPHHRPKSYEASQPQSKTTETASHSNTFLFLSLLSQMIFAAGMESWHSVTTIKHSVTTIKLYPSPLPESLTSLLQSRDDAVFSWACEASEIALCKETPFANQTHSWDGRTWVEFQLYLPPGQAQEMDTSGSSLVDLVPEPDCCLWLLLNVEASLVPGPCLLSIICFLDVLVSSSLNRLTIQ
jgi:hypothetical protein